MSKLAQMKESLLELAFICLLIKLLIPGAGFPEAVGLVIVVISMAYNKLLTKEKNDKEAEHQKAMDELRSAVKSMEENSKEIPSIIKRLGDVENKVISATNKEMFKDLIELQKERNSSEETAKLRKPGRIF